MSDFRGVEIGAPDGRHIVLMNRPYWMPPRVWDKLLEMVGLHDD